MKTAVLMRLIVDLVEEIVVEDNALDRDAFIYKVNEFDTYALVEALQSKGDGSVDVYILDGDGADQALHEAKARGADNLFKVTIDGYDDDRELSTKEVAKAFAQVLKDKNYDVIVTGIQGVSDLDGLSAGLVASELGVPSINVVNRVDPADGGKVTVFKEFAGGVLAEYEVDTPVVLGMQTSREPPSYIPVSKIRKMAADATIEEMSVSVPDVSKSAVTGYSLPESSSHAEMIEGDMDEQIDKFIALLKEKGIVS